MEYGNATPLADFGAGIAWVLLVGPLIAWLLGQFWFSGAGRRMGLLTPLATTVAGMLILIHLQRWPMTYLERWF